MISVAQAAFQLDVCQSRIRALIRSGRIKARKIGRDYAVSEISLRAFRPKPQGWPLGKKRKDRRHEHQQ